MAFDYSGLLDTANRLIADFGRPITLRRQSELPNNPAQPWGERDPDGADVQSIDTIGAFLDSARGGFTAVTTGVGLGATNVEEKTTRVLVPAVPLLPEEMGTDWRVDDGTRLYEMVVSKPVKPGGTLIYYDLEVKL